jgi:hypothetical protein
MKERNEMREQVRRVMCMSVTMLAAAGLMMSAASAQDTKRQAPQGTTQLKKADVNAQLKRGDARQAGAQGMQNECGSNQQLTGKFEYQNNVCNRGPCPPNPTEDCRRWHSVCMNSNGQGTYDADGTWKCEPSINKEPDSKQGDGAVPR